MANGRFSHCAGTFVLFRWTRARLFAERFAFKNRSRQTQQSRRRLHESPTAKNRARRV